MGDSESSGWGDSSQDNQEDTTKTSSDTVIENSMVDKSTVVHIENTYVSDMASSLVSSPPYAGGEDERLATTEAQAYANNITESETTRSTTKSKESTTKTPSVVEPSASAGAKSVAKPSESSRPKSVTEPPASEKAVSVAGSSASAGRKSATKSTVSGKSKSVQR